MTINVLPAQENAVTQRARTFFKGIVYFDNRRASADCTIREMSQTGARLIFTTRVTIPDNIELYIPHKKETLEAIVRERFELELDISFKIHRSDDPRRSDDTTAHKRIAELELEVSALKRIVKRLVDKVLPVGDDLI